MVSDSRLKRAVRGGVRNFCSDHPQYGIPRHMEESLVKRIVGQIQSLIDCRRETGAREPSESPPS